MPLPPPPRSAADGPLVPLNGRWFGLVLGLAVAATLAVVLWQRQASPLAEDSPPVLWQRSLHFEDRPNGDIGVVDAQTRQEVARFAGEQGFVRGALRALARERVRSGFGPEQPFELIGHVNGRVTLRDDTTGARIHLESFGPSNAALFSRLRSATPAAASSDRPQGAKS